MAQQPSGFAPMSLESSAAADAPRRGSSRPKGRWAWIGCIVVTLIALVALVILLVQPLGSATEGSSSSPHSLDPDLKDFYHLYFIGDWGRPHSATTDLLASVSAVQPPAYVVSVGDNFYERGVSSVSDSLFTSMWKSFLVKGMKDIRWFVALGNHDHYGNASAQVLYSLVDPRWILPAMYYRVEFPLDGSTPLLFLPTNITAAGALPNYQLQKGQTTPTTRRLRSEGTVKMTNTDAVPCVSITFLDTHRLAHGSGEYDSLEAQLQLDWAEAELAKAKHCIASFVVGHHTIYTSGIHGATDMDVKQLLEKYDVDAYVCGHDHHLEYMYDRAQNIDYILSGAGSALRSFEKEPLPQTVYREAENGFVDLAIDPSTGELVYTYFTANGHEFRVRRTAKGWTRFQATPSPTPTPSRTPSPSPTKSPTPTESPSPASTSSPTSTVAR